MNTINLIGLNRKDSEVIALKLQELLANYSFFYQNVRGLHWNIRGEKFFELHLKYEELYTDLHTKIDEIAERILTLGNQPEHAFSKYMHLSTIPERASGVLDKQAVQDILDSFQIIIQLERQILALAQDSSDEGTSALMSDYIRNQEKTIWMYAAYLGTAQS